MLLTRASSINRALDQIGDKWSLMILQEVFWGLNSFSEMTQATGASKGVMSDRLKWLQQIDCLKKDEQKSRRPKYVLTRKSLALYPAALMAIAFERQFYSNPRMDEIDLTHKSCGHAFQPRMVCGHCQQDLHSMDVKFIPGEGASQDQRATKVRRRSSSLQAGTGQNHNLYENMIHLIGDRWTANVIALAFHRIKRFDGFHKELPVATNILASRLKFLVDEGVFAQVRYEQKPPRYEYQLTPLGEGLFPIFVALLQWGDDYCDINNAGRPMRLEHRLCGQELVGKVVCGECQDEIIPRSVSFNFHR